MQTSQIRDDWAGTFAICDPWACLLPFWVPHFPLLCWHHQLIPHPCGPGWHVERGSEAHKRRGRGTLQQGAGQVVGTLCSLREASVAAAEKSCGSPLPFPGRTGRRQHLLKLWSLALLPPGAIWKPLLGKLWALSEELRGAGLGQSFGPFFLGRT